MDSVTTAEKRRKKAIKSDRDLPLTEAKPGKAQGLFDSFDPLKGERLRILDPEGRVADERFLPELSDGSLVSAYRRMLSARIVDAKSLIFQRQKRVHTLPVNQGQEAAAVGSAMALRDEDWMVQAYRELGAVLARGGTIRNHLLYFKGSEEGSVFPEAPRILPVSVPIASQITHAAGIGHAIRYRGGREVVLVYFGDGGTSQGDFHEGLNWAAVFDCPVIFFCNNNQYAISLPRAKQTRARTLAQKALAYGMPGLQVDGNDFLAVHAATLAAAEHARAGEGPVLLEAYTYRMGAHTTSDDPSIYRSVEEEERWATRDPLLRMRRFLEGKGLWSEDQQQRFSGETAAEVDAVMRELDELPETPPADVFDYQYAEKPAELQEQQRRYEEFLKWKENR